MPLKIEIPDSAVDATRTLYTDIATGILGKLNSAQKEWDDIQPILKQLNINLKPNTIRHSESSSNLSTTNGQLNGYESNWGWAKKASYVIQKKGKPLTAKEIVEFLVNEIDQEISRDLAQNSIPSTLSQDAKKGKFRRIDKGGDYYYDLPRTNSN